MQESLFICRMTAGCTTERKARNSIVPMSPFQDKMSTNTNEIILCYPHLPTNRKPYRGESSSGQSPKRADSPAILLSCTSHAPCHERHGGCSMEPADADADGTNTKRTGEEYS